VSDDDDDVDPILDATRHEIAVRRQRMKRLRVFAVVLICIFGIVCQSAALLHALDEQDHTYEAAQLGLWCLWLAVATSRIWEFIYWRRF